MKTRKRTVIAILVAVIGTAPVFLFGYHETLYGWAAQRFFEWEEESFKGRPFSELQSYLTRQGKGLRPVDSGTIYSLTDKSLKPNQRAMSFIKGKEYRWFRYGTAINVGYVVVEKEAKSKKSWRLFALVQ